MNLVLLGVLLVLGSGVAAVALRRRPALGDLAFRAGMTAGAAAGGVAAVRALGGATVNPIVIAANAPGGPWVFGLDALSGLFLLAILVVGTAAAWYGVTYMHQAGNPRGAGTAHGFLALLIAAMSLTVVARAAVPFLISWEVMALTSYALIVTEHGREEHRRAGMLYLVATHVGTLSLFALFAVWGDGARDLSFASLSDQALSPRLQAFALCAALVGFGIKAGVVPFHFWLPEAHAAAPSHVSAVMSGVVIKLGIYGLMRLTLLIHQPPAWWGWLLLTLGVISGVLGVLWALAQHDLKRLLAYHSVENIGIILLGLGVGSLGVTYRDPLVAVLGFGGAALHTMNHAVFKSLLFLGAGSVDHATGTRELDRLGGLARCMPATMAVFLVGSAAIVGLPPLNGFVSEWLVFRALFAAGLSGTAMRIAVLAAAALGAIGALALACFAKVTSVMFLGTARDPSVAGGHESARGMLWPMYALASVCVAIGVLPSIAVPAAKRIGALVAGAAIPGDRVIGAIDPAAANVQSLALALVVAIGLVWLVRSFITRDRDVRRGVTWACGFPHQTARMQTSASSFATPLLDAYGAVSGVRVHRTSGALYTETTDPVLDGLVEPAWHGVRVITKRFHPLQRGRLSLYLMYIVMALVAVLIYLVAAGPTS